MESVIDTNCVAQYESGLFTDRLDSSINPNACYVETSHSKTRPKRYRNFKRNIMPSLFVDSELFEFINQLQISDTTGTADNAITIISQKFDEKYKDRFDRLLHITEFEDGEDNDATRMFAEMLNDDKSASLALIQTLFIKYFGDKDDRDVIKVLKLLSDYSYEELMPYAQTIAISAHSYDSPLVQIASLNLFAHWCNPQALQLVEAMETPSNIMARVVYKSVKNSLTKKCSLSEK